VSQALGSGAACAPDLEALLTVVSAELTAFQAKDLSRLPPNLQPKWADAQEDLARSTLARTPDFHVNLGVVFGPVSPYRHDG
jgi:hypothetical protein